MNNISFIRKLLPVIVVTLLCLTGCKETWLMYDTTQKSHLVFRDPEDKNESVKEIDRVFSFVFEPEDEVEYVITAELMGTVVNVERTFAVEVIKDTAKTFTVSTTETKNIISAQRDTHYTITKAVVPANSTKGYVYLKVKRTPDMIDNAVSIKMIVSESENFIAMKANTFRLIATDGEPLVPSWWKTVYLGTTTNWYMYTGDFTPLKFRKLLEFYHEMKTSNPVQYQLLEEKYGPYLDKPQYDDKTGIYSEIKAGFFQTGGAPAVWAKYVLCPLYDYFKANYPTIERGGYLASDASGITATTGGWKDPKGLYR